jgi:hypothetical protein
MPGIFCCPASSSQCHVWGSWIYERHNHHHYRSVIMPYRKVKAAEGEIFHLYNRGALKTTLFFNAQMY